MNLLRNIERRIDERLRKLFGSEPEPGQGRDMVEVQRFVLDLVEQKVQSLPRARRVFPYSEMVVRIPVPGPGQQAAFEAVFLADGALAEEILDHLRREEVEFPRDLRVEVTLYESADPADPSLVCRKREAEQRVAEPASTLPARTRFTPLEGGEPVEVSAMRIQVGRTAEVLDDRRRLVRRNQVVFEHHTVSRAHAHIEYRAGEYRLFDDGSSCGTSVIHEGRLVEVPRAGGRGLRIVTGDEIYFGQVRARFELLAGAD